MLLHNRGDRDLLGQTCLFATEVLIWGRLVVLWLACIAYHYAFILYARHIGP
ncbi:hypothetical protein BDW74DRAFT_4995 [Aspergillus multicolor]|uniref:uncharacterized protein n=1 Tax=Aspergillus multicolor TaxID=41759 RepID=UPI003CCC9F68